MTVFSGFFGVVLGALAGVVATYLTTRSKMRIELEHSYDRALRDKRLECYQELFHVSRCIPRYWPTQVPTREDLHRFRQAFHDWYFGKDAGGMFLSPAAKGAYMRLQDALGEAMHAGENGGSTPPLSDIQLYASELRHQLAADVGAANPPRLAWTRLDRTVPPPFVARSGSDGA
ncbi:MAG TPA: hypothetical protein VGN37_18985 [Actinocatenispora sp.]